MMVDQKTRRFWSGASLYRAYAGRFFAKMHNELIARMSSRIPDALLDIACGSGDFLVRIHDAFPTTRIAGSDIAPGMLSRAQSKLPPGTALIESPADTQPFGDESFDVVTTLMAFHHFSQPVQVLREAHRLLVSGGIYYIADVVAPSSWLKKCWNVLEQITGIRGYVGHYTDSDMRKWAGEASFTYESFAVPRMAKRYRIMKLTRI